MSIERTPAQPRHLHTRDEIARVGAGPDGVVAARRRGEGNGVRVHLALFAATSVVVLVLAIGSIALASRMM